MIAAGTFWMNRMHRPWRIGAMALVLLALWIGWNDAVPRVIGVAQAMYVWREHTTQIEAASQWYSRRDTLAYEQDVLEETLDALVVGLPDGDRISTVVDVIQAAADSADVTLTRIHPKLWVEREASHVLPVKVDLLGSYHASGLFVDLLERAAFPIRVEQMGMAAPGLTGTTAETTLDLHIITLRDDRP